MKNAGTRLMGQWFLAVALGFLGLVLGGATCARPTADQWPARVQARAVFVQQGLQRRTQHTESKLEETNAAPALALLLLVLAFDARRTTPFVVRVPGAPRQSSLWLMPYLFRPPPAILVR